MPDVFTKQKRSQVMAAVRSRGNKATELRLASILRGAGITGWRRHQRLPGCPDFIFRRQRLDANQQQTWTSLPAFLDQCASPPIQNLITEATTEERHLPNPAQQLADITLKLRNQYIDRQMAALMQRINQPSTSEAEQLDLLRHQQELRHLKRQPLNPEK